MSPRRKRTHVSAVIVSVGFPPAYRRRALPAWRTKSRGALPPKVPGQRRVLQKRVLQKRVLQKRILQKKGQEASNCSIY
eukprot:scaffold12166_cov49-Phaeocystis_antarctica.AAC.2